MPFIRLNCGDGGRDRLVNVDEIEIVVDEGAPASIVFRSGRTIMFNETIDDISALLVQAGEVVLAMDDVQQALDEPDYDLEVPR